MDKAVTIKEPMLKIFVAYPIRFFLFFGETHPYLQVELYGNLLKFKRYSVSNSNTHLSKI